MYKRFSLKRFARSCVQTFGKCISQSSKNSIGKPRNAKTLMPKNMGIRSIRYFHLINLVSCMYKILAKVLANRLKPLLGKIMPKVPNCFFGREIKIRLNSHSQWMSWYWKSLWSCELELSFVHTGPFLLWWEMEEINSYLFHHYLIFSSAYKPLWQI